VIPTIDIAPAADTVNEEDGGGDSEGDVGEDAVGTLASSVPHPQDATTTGETAVQISVPLK
jgi:hypothetical protein